MRDQHLVLMVAVPAALSILGALWLLRRRSQDKKDSRKDAGDGAKQEKRAEQSAQLQNQQAKMGGGNQDGITITQRKIPESSARDRGSSDLSQTPRKPANTDKEVKADLGSGDLTRAQDERVEAIVTSAMGRGLQEAAARSRVASGPKPSAVGKTGQSGNWPSSKEAETWSDPQPQRADGSKSTQSNTLPSETLPSVSSSKLTSRENTEKVVLSGGPTSADKSALFSNNTSKSSTSTVVENVDNVSSTSIISSSSQPLDTTKQQISENTTPQCSTVLSAVSKQDTPNQDKTSSVGAGVKKDTNLDSRKDVTKQASGEPLTSKDTSSDKSPNDTTKSSVSVNVSSSPVSQSTMTTKNDSNSRETSSPVNTKPSSTTPSAESPAVPLAPAEKSSASSEKEEESSLVVESRVSPSSDSASVLEGSVDSQPATGSDATSPVGDTHSEGSNDSGRGCSDQDNRSLQADEPLVHYDFNMPSDLCGRFIGRQGRNINYLKTRTGANVALVNNPFTPAFQICQVVGTQSEVDDALCMIRQKFPVSEHPHLTMQALNVKPNPEQHVLVPEGMQLSLPEGVSVEVYVSAIVDAGHVFVQQPTHRSFMSLEKLGIFLASIYGQDPNIPPLPKPIEYGVICVCETEGAWYRAMVTSVEDEAGECQVKFVDYGGFAMLPASSLKQIRTDFMTLPFQAVECFLANITPLQNESTFSLEANMALLEMSESKLLQCQVVARTETGLPYIHLYQVDAHNNTAVMINRALVNSRLVRWIEILQKQPLQAFVPAGSLQQ